MEKPEISKDFNMDDIRKLRDYNSDRHLTMDNEKIKEESRKAMEEFLLSIGKSEKLGKIV